MGRGPKETLLQRRHIDGQEVHAKRLNTAYYQRNANQNYKEITSHQLEWPSSKNLQTINAGDGMKKRKPYTVAAAAAESLQFVSDSVRPHRWGSPPGSPIPGILQARTLEWAAISFSSA